MRFHNNNHNHNLQQNSTNTTNTTKRKSVQKKRQRQRQQLSNFLVALLPLLLLVIITGTTTSTTSKTSSATFTFVQAFTLLPGKTAATKGTSILRRLHSSSSSSLSATEATETTSTSASTKVSKNMKLPNWRPLTVHKEHEDDDGVDDEVNLPTPFAHTITNSDNTESADSSTTTTQINAPWSHKGYKSALKLYKTLTDDANTDSYISPHISDALEALEQSYRLYGGPENVIGSFNGGKDAVVILELMRAAHAKYYHDLFSAADTDDTDTDTDTSAPTLTLDEDGCIVGTVRPRVIYFNHRLEFPQVYDFVQNAVHEYDLDMIAFGEGIGFVDGLDILVKNNYVLGSSSSSSSSDDKNGIVYPMAFVLGTRNSDPNAGTQSHFAPSSTWMPAFMRVNPVIDWTYGHIWHFLRLFRLPYCSLYDEGYTSLGHVEDTLPCPALKKVSTSTLTSNSSTTTTTAATAAAVDGGEDQAEYWPAYMLKDWDQERAGRVKKEKKKKAKSKDTTTSTPATTSASTTLSPPKTEPAAAATATQSDDTSDDSSTTTISQRTVGIIVIGDEILKGLTPDTNTHTAASALRLHNVPLSRVSVVSDDLDEIIEEIQKMSTKVDIIITSGGVGPTHDDVTIKSVSIALDSELMLNQHMADLLISKMNGEKENKEELSEAQIKMATLPACAKLRYLTKNKHDWPVLQCGNIFILPGVPQFFEKKVQSVASYLSTELERSVSFKVVLSIDEPSIVTILNTVVENHPNVSFGSYPFVNHPEYKTVVTLEGRRVEGGTMRNSSRYLIPLDNNFDLDEDDIQFRQNEIELNVKLALSDLVNRMPEGAVLRVDNNDDLTYN